jgi:AcrR family transcriptional regulator
MIMATPDIPTRQRILDAALDLFGNRGVDAVSLDEIARVVGVRKQTVLYWFASKDDLVEAVLSEAVAELLIVVEAALRAAPADPLARIDALVTAVFRPAVRRPALLGLIGEIGRLSVSHASHLATLLEPSVDRAIAALRAEMDAGRIRRADPALLAALIYSTVTGLATEARVLGTVGWMPSPAGLRTLRTELRAFVRAALAPETPIRVISP